MFKKILVVAAMSLLAFAGAANAQNVVYGKVSEIFYNNSVAPDSPGIVVKLTPASGYDAPVFDSCVANGQEMEWKLQLDNNMFVAQAQLKALQEAKEYLTVVRVAGDPNVCASGETVYEDKIVDLYPYD